LTEQAAVWAINTTADKEADAITDTTAGKAANTTPKKADTKAVAATESSKAADAESNTTKHRRYSSRVEEFGVFRDEAKRIVTEYRIDFSLKVFAFSRKYLLKYFGKSVKNLWVCCKTNNSLTEQLIQKLI
jgi:hypothetical protein